MAQNTNNYSELSDYVDIHGRDIRVMVCEKTGAILIPIDEVRKTGFNIYRKSQYDKLHVDDNQFDHEFNLFMLQSAQSYMLTRKYVFKENDIIESINNCMKLLTNRQDTLKEAQSKTPRSSFLENHIIESEDNTNISITSKGSASTTEILKVGESKSRGFNPKASPASVLHSYKNGSPEDRQINMENKSSSFSSNERTSNNLFERRRSNLTSNESNSPPDQRAPANTLEQRKPNFMPKQNNFKRDSRNFKTSDQRNGYSNVNIQPVQEESSIVNRLMPKPGYGSSSNLSQHSKESDGERPEIKKLVTIDLNKPQHTIMVTFVEKTNCLWVQDADSVDVLVDIDLKIQEDVVKHKECKTFLLEKVYLAQDDGSWYRCKIIKFKPQKSVFFIDYGNTAQLADNAVILNASDELAAIPCQAARITFKPSQGTPQLFETITVKISKRYDNLTYAVDIINETEPPPKPAVTEHKPTTPTFFQKPQPLCSLTNGQRVMVVALMEDKLAMRTRECYEKQKQIDDAIKKCQTEVVDNVRKGQIVLVQKDSVARGMVTNIQGALIEVMLFDHLETRKVNKATIRHITKSLSLEPLTYVMSPAVTVLDESAREFINELVKTKEKCTVVLKGSNFDLQLTDKLLSEALKPNSSNLPMLKDLPLSKVELGADAYMVSSFRNVDDVTLTSQEDMATHLEDILISEMEDDHPHEPKMGEVCFGQYQDNWSRCVAVRQLNGRYEVKFIDFGNLEFLRAEQLRKLAGHALTTPVLGIPCRLTGLPRVNRAESIIKDLIQPLEAYNVNIKKFDGEVYEIELPDLYEKMRNSV